MKMNRRDFVKFSTLLSGVGILPRLRSEQIDLGPKPVELLASPRPSLGELLYQNSLAKMADVESFRLEGPCKVSFPNERLRLESGNPPAGQVPNFVFWCPRDFPDRIAISWKFWPLHEPGLAMMFFAARGRDGKDLFDPSLKKRSGDYPQYHHGDIDAFHSSYFRRIQPGDRNFHYCNLRKSHGLNLVATGADPIPEVAQTKPPFHLMIVKDGAYVGFWIDYLRIFEWRDDGKEFGPLLTGGKIGFRQMAPLVAEYADLKVHALAANV